MGQLPSNRRRFSRLLGLLILLVGLPVFGLRASAAVEDWRTIVPGVTFREFVLPGPVHAYVARMDITAADVALESSIAGGSLAVGRETVSEMARRYSETLASWGGTWGPRQRVVVAVNGSSYVPESGDPYGGLVYDGWYARRFGDLAGGSGLAWTQDRRAAIGGCVDHDEERNIVRLPASGRQMSIDSINREREDDGLLLFTPQYDGWTPENNGDIEIVVELPRPAGIVPLPRSVTGIVREQRQGHGRTPILFDQVVLTARGPQAETLARAMARGDIVEISQEITDLGGDCGSSPRLDWSNVYASIGGGFEFLARGEIHSSDDAGAAVHDPRTAFCLNDEHVDFVVVDGRQEGYSVGMTLDELAGFCRDDLGDTYGINQDGGGSSALWVDGAVVNRPSDGQERAVANGMMMVVMQPPARSSRFAPGFRVLVQQSDGFRMGPGLNYPARDDLRQGTMVELLPTQPMVRGVLATGVYWWKALYDGEEGWVPETSLVSRLEAMAIFEIPGLPSDTP